MTDSRLPALFLSLFLILTHAVGITGAAPTPRAVPVSTSGGATPGGWQAAVSEDIAAREYDVSWQAPVWQAPNRAQGFRTRFGDEGIRVVPRTEQSPSWTWELTLVGYGRGDALWEVDAASPVPSRNRVEYHRGQVEEWYVNDPRGLEQGFDLRSEPEEAARQGGMRRRPGRAPLPARPAAARRHATSDGPVETPAEELLHLDLALSGSLMPLVAADGQAIDFALPGGERVVRYAHLLVEDATGRALPAWMEGVSDEAVSGIRIVVDDRGASYPIRIDPLTTSPSWTADGGQGFALFGNSVATAGDVNGDGYSDVIVGAENYDNGETDEGRAFVYLGSASGLSFTPAWTAEINQAGANFGYNVGTAGDVNGDGYSDVLVGSSLYDNGETNEGSASLYLGSPTGPSLSAAWTAEGNQAGANFGDVVSTAGDVNGDGYSDVLVGAPYHDNGQIDEGRAYLYLGSVSGLATSPVWVVESDQVGAAMGFSLATAGDVNGDGYSDVVAGAPFYDNGEVDEGRAFVYMGSPSGLATTAAWTAESNQASARFGWSAATGGDINGDGYADVVVGAPSYDSALTDQGLVYQYFGSAGGLSPTSPMMFTYGQAFVYFGSSVAAVGDVNGDGYADVIAGMPYVDLGETDEGGAMMLFGSEFGLNGTLPIQIIQSNQPFAYFGAPVAAAGDVNGDGYSDVIAGAYAFDTPGQTDAGGAFVYLGGAGGPSLQSSWTAESDQSSANAGFSLASAGDVNGDGYSDVIVGVPSYDNGQTDEGRALVYLGGAGGLATAPAWTAEGDQPAAFFAFSVSTAGDVNGDGYSDVIIGAYAFDNGQLDEGRAFVYFGSVSGLGQTPAWTAESDQAGAWLGAAVASAGDVNGDGYSDVLAGASLYDNGQSDEGRAFLYLGSAGGPALTPAWTAESNVGGARLGGALATAGDVNGDGHADVLVGAPTQDTAVIISAGAATLYLGSAGGLAPLPTWTVTGVQQIENFGWSVSTAGDVNGDGYSDILVGAPGLDDLGQTAAGAAMVYLGSSTGPSTLPAWTARGGQFAAYFGWSVAAAGDVNGDGFSDVLVGAPYFDNGQVDEGRASLFFGSAAGLGTLAAWTAESDQPFADLGYSVAGAGDVNGDGYADLLMGAPYYDNGLGDEGRALFYYGNGSRGVSLRPRQRRADDAAPIALGLRSRVPGSFRLAALGRGGLGRGMVKLEWEVKPRGRAFDGTGTQRSAAWTDTGAAGAAMSASLSGLEPGIYHWRVRMLYKTATSPFSQASRWFAKPLNGAMETDVALSAFIGGVVWEDLDGDGLRGSGEPRLARLQVFLQNSDGMSTGATFTDNQGNYRFEILDAAAHRIAFTLPAGYQYALPDQGADDTLDSDADPFTGQTPILGPPFQAVDGISWGAGMLRIGPCVPPDEPVYIYNARLSPDGQGFTILDFQDANQAFQKTGYNVRRSSSAAPPKSAWALMATNVVDMDAATSNLQWVDTSGAVSPSGVWYYDVTAYNAACGAEGPF